jgi:hypothetical protein
MLINVRYLTGFTGSNAIVLVGPDTRLFLTDFRYVEQAAAEVDASFDRRIVTQDLVDAVSETLPPGSPRLGFEDAHLTGVAAGGQGTGRDPPDRGGDEVGRRRVPAHPGARPGGADRAGRGDDAGARDA